MVDELKKALDKVRELPEGQQKALASLILNEIEWEHSFQSSLQRLSSLAKELLLSTRRERQNHSSFNAIPNHFEVLEKF